MAPQILFIAAPMGKANLDSQTTQPTNKSPAGLAKRRGSIQPQGPTENPPSGDKAETVSGRALQLAPKGDDL